MKIIFSIILVAISSQICKSQNFYKMGLDEYNSGDIDQAILLFDTAILNNENLSSSYLFRGASYLLLFDTVNAQLNITKAKQIDSNLQKLNYYLGKLSLLKGEYSSALKYYTISIQKDSSISNSYADRGIVKLYMNDFSGALLDCDSAILFNPLEKSYYSDRGFINIKMGNYNKAIKDLNKSISISPSSKAYSNRGYVHLLMANYKKAILDFTESLQLFPDDPEILFYRGLAYNEIGDKIHSCDDLTKSAKLGYKKSIDIICTMDCLYD